MTASTQQPPDEDRPIALWYPLLLVGIGVACWGNAFDYPFLQDDYFNIWHGRFHGWADVPRAMTVQLPFYRPVSNAWYFGLGDALWGLNPDPYHFINLAVFIVGAWMVSEIGGRLTGSVLAGRLAGAIYLVAPAHLVPIYWISVMTQGWLEFWFIAAWYLDLRAWETRSVRWRAAASIAFGFCAFSNINGFTLAPVLTAFAWLREPDRRLVDVLRAQWSYYAWGAAWAFMQFVVLEWPSLPNYAIAGGSWLLGRVELVMKFSLYTMAPLYGVVELNRDRAVLVYLIAISVILLTCAFAYAHAKRSGSLTRPVAISLGLLVLLMGYALGPYLMLERHFAAYHAGISSVAVAIWLAWAIAQLPSRTAAIGCATLWVVVSIGCILQYERTHHDTQGIGWKGKLAETTIADLRGMLDTYPQTKRIMIVDHDPLGLRIMIVDHHEHLLWLFRKGYVHDQVLGRPDIVVYDGLAGPLDTSPASDKLVVRAEGFGLTLVQPPTPTAP